MGTYYKDDGAGCTIRCPLHSLLRVIKTIHLESQLCYSTCQLVNARTSTWPRLQCCHAVARQTSICRPKTYVRTFRKSVSSVRVASSFSRLLSGDRSRPPSLLVLKRVVRVIKGMLGWRWWCGLALLALILGLFGAEKSLLGKADVKEDMASLPGGKFQADGEENSLEIEEIAKFAVDEHNGRQNSAENLTYVRVVSAKKQVVAGTMYHLTIEVLSEGRPKLYEAKVWSKPWEQHKSLEEFKPASHSAVTPADLGARRDGQHSNSGGDQGLKEVPCDDPVVKEAAVQALKGLQQRSNSLFPYELQDVLSALAEVTGEKTNFQLLLKVKRGTREEHVKAEVHRTADGDWNVGHAQPQ